MSTASCSFPPPPTRAPLHHRARPAPTTLKGRADDLIKELRTRCRSRRLLPGQRRLRPEQVAAIYGVHGVNTAASTAVQAAMHATGSATEAVWTGAGAAAGLVAGASAPGEAVKTGLDILRSRRKARAAWGQVEEAAARLTASRARADAAQEARDWLDRRHHLEAWVVTRRCFQGSLPQLQRREKRWRRELRALRQQATPSRSAIDRRTRLEHRLQAVRCLGLKRIAELGSGAVSVEKRLKEGMSAGRNLGGLTGIASTLAAGGSPFMAFLATAVMPLLLPLLLLVDGVAGTVEATQLIRRARAGRRQLDARMARLDRAIGALKPAQADAPAGLFARGLTVVRGAGHRQARQWRRELWQGWIRRVRSAAYVGLAPVALGLGAAALAAASVTPAGWAVIALLGTVAVGYCIAQVVLNHWQARQGRAVVVRQQDHAELARRANRDWAGRTDQLADPVWAGNEYLAIELLVRALVKAANDDTAWSGLDRVLAKDLACGRSWRGHLRQLAQQVRHDAPPDHDDVWRLSEALMRRFGLPVPKPRHRPGAA